MIRNWKPEKIITAVANQVAANGDAVGSYVERDARRRLLAIRDPEWGEKYRRFVVGRLLTHEIERKRREVVIAIGVKATAESRHHGFYIETGSSTAPAHPWLRPAVFNNARTIVGLLSQ